MHRIRLNATVAGAALALALAAVGDASAAVHLQRLPLSPTGADATTTRAATRWVALGAVSPRPGAALAAVAWRSGDVRAIRVRGIRADGTRTAWVELSTADTDVATDGRHVVGPAWLGSVRRIEAEAQGRIEGARVTAIDPGADALPLAQLLASRAETTTGVAAPSVVTRAQWGADESIRRSAARYAPSVRYAVVHHTQGSNTYTRGQAPAVVRGIYAYHTLELGWNDIGYNALVDRFGTIYEGRAGGLARATVGAHARGFNYGSFGVSMIGSYMRVLPPAAQTAAVAAIVAWRLDVAHVDPLGQVEVESGGGGGARWREGVDVTLRTIVGHRDVNFTDCPGDRFYPRLEALRQAVMAVPGLRIMSPVVKVDGTTATIGARISAAASWRVSVLDGERVVGTATGSGQDAALTFTAPANLAPRLTQLDWRIEATAGPDPASTARPAIGRLDGSAPGEPPPPPGAPVASLVAQPDTIEGDATRVRVRWLQGVAARTAVVVEDAAGTRLAVLRRWGPVGTGPQVVDWDGRGPSGPLPSGIYTVRVLLSGATPADGATVEVAVRRELRGLVASPLVSPNGDGRLDRLRLRFDRVEPGTVSAYLARGEDRIVWRIYGRVRQPAGVFSSTFRIPRGLEGTFVLRIQAPGRGGTQVLEAPVRIDRTPPIVRLYRVLRVGKSRFRSLRLKASEPVSFVIRARDGHVVRRGTLVPGFQNVSVRRTALTAGVRLYAWDTTGIRAKALRLRAR